MTNKLARFEKGATIFTEGDVEDELYFIKKGRVELYVKDPFSAENVFLTILEEGSILGTMAFLEAEPRSATAIAFTDIECIVIGKEARVKLMEKIPEWFKIFIKDLTSSVRKQNEKYSALRTEHNKLLKKFVDLKQSAQN